VCAQVTRRWLNFEGEAVAEHLAGELAALEADPRVRSTLERPRAGQDK